MAGPEVIGLLGAMAGLVEGSKMIYKNVHNIMKFTKERSELEELLGTLETQLVLLRKHAEKADKADPAEKFLFDGLFELEMLQDEKRKSEQEKEPRNRKEQVKQEKQKELLKEHIGALAYMKRDMDTMLIKLKPGETYVERTRQRLAWSKHKSEIGRLRESFRQWRETVEFALNFDRHTLLEATYQIGKDTKQQTAEISVDVKDVKDEMAQLRLGMAEQQLRGARRDQERQEKEKQKLIQAMAAWLSPLDFSIRHQELLEIENPEDMTQELKASDEFEAWVSGGKWALYCFADAGAGKTVSTSMMIEYVQDLLKDNDIPVLYLYLNAQDQKAHNLANLYGNLLKQLITYDDRTQPSEALIEQYKRKVGKSHMTTKERKEAFCLEASLHERVIVVVDALDEGSQLVKDTCRDLLDEIDFGTISLMVTTRDEEPDRKKAMICDGCPSHHRVNLYYACYQCPAPGFFLCYACIKKEKTCPGQHVLDDAPQNPIYLDISPSRAAIERYVKKAINKEANAGHTVSANNELGFKRVGVSALGHLRQDDPELETRVIKSICDNSNAFFLLAKLYVEAFKNVKNVAGIKYLLAHLPDGYSAIYKQTMERIAAGRNDDFALARTVISWITWAQRPLSVDELRHALATTESKGYDPDEQTPEDEILKVTGGLVKAYNGTFQLMHATAYHYFLGEGDTWLGLDGPGNIATICLCYLATETLRRPLEAIKAQEDYDARIQQYPFASYAYEYWGDHARDAIEIKQVRMKVLDYLTNKDNVAAFVQAFWYLQSSAATRWEIRKHANALHVAAWFGLTDVIPDLIEAGIDVDHKDPSLQQTPLFLAARQGHARTVGMLLQQGASINDVSSYGSTAMWEACENGRLDIALLLLMHKDLDINFRFPWREDWTILMAVARYEKPDFTNAILLNKRNEVDINAVDRKGFSVLVYACSYGHMEVVRSLLQHPKIDVNINKFLGRTPLIAIATIEPARSVEIAKMLLARNANTQAKDNEDGGTVMIRAAEAGNLELLQALHLHDAHLLKQYDDGGRNAIHAAAYENQSHVVQFAVDKGIEVNTRDHQGRTPLHHAARRGASKTIQLLLDLGARSQNDVSGRAPWEVAWQNNRLGALSLLRDDVELGFHDDGLVAASGQNLPTLPLWALVKHDRGDEIEKLARESPELFAAVSADPDTGDSAVHFAVNFERSHILKFLLDETSFSLTAPNLIGRTPLHYAARIANTAMIKTLLSHPRFLKDDTHLNPRDRNDQTPLDIANDEYKPRAASLLIGAGAHIEHKSMILPTFFKAIEYGYLDAVRVLIHEYKAPVNAKNGKGESAMAVARMAGWGEIERELNKSKSLYVPVSSGRIEEINLDEEDEDIFYDAEQMDSPVEMAQEGKVPFERPLGLEDEDEDEDEYEVLRKRMLALQRDDKHAERGEKAEPETRMLVPA